MRVYVITASKHGSTSEIGAAIGHRLRERGHDAIAIDAEDAGRLDDESAIVLGSPIYMGKWLKPARNVMDALADEPAGRLIFTFTVGPVGEPPKPADAEPDEAVQRFCAERAVSDRMFAGKLDRSKLGRLERLAVNAVKSPDGDYRNWPAIEAWADQISDALVAAQSVTWSRCACLRLIYSTSPCPSTTSRTRWRASVAADRESTWQALVTADLIEVGRRRPMVAFLGFSRLLPELASHLLHGEGIPDQPEHMRLKETAQSPAIDGGWMLLGEREPEELALGLVGKFWRPVIEYAALEASDFAASGPGGRRPFMTSS